MNRIVRDSRSDPSSGNPLPGQRGLFTDGSMIRRIGQEALPLLGGGRAVLLQLAHPLVAAGVGDHSNFQSDPLERLYGTLELMHALVFGDRQHVEGALKKFHAMHARINGQISQAIGPYARGRSYTGDDPELKLWVYATLVDTSLISYERFVTPLSAAEREQYYRETKVVARSLGISEADLPPNLTAFGNYMKRMLASDVLAVTDESRELAWHVLDPTVQGLQYASASLLRFVTAGLLPERFRHAFGLRWGARRQALLDGLSRTTRLLRPVAPRWLWQSPQLGGASFLRRILWPAR